MFLLDIRCFELVIPWEGVAVAERWLLLSSDGIWEVGLVKLLVLLLLLRGCYCCIDKVIVVVR